MMARTLASQSVESMVRKYRRGLVTSMLEYLILDNAEKSDVCGYDVIARLCLDFDVLLSPGQVYPTIDSLSSNGILEKKKNGRRTSLRLTPLGHVLLKAWREELGLMQLRLNNGLRPVERLA
jgi:DNA-binding PadR family transcriptional regulator